MLLITLVSLLQVLAFSQPNPDARHELTIFVIPSAVEYDWSSPHSLYHTYKLNYIKNIFKKEKYILGHAFVEIRSPIVNDRLLTGMRSCGREQQRDLVLHEKYGLTILGMDLQGRLELHDDLAEKVENYSRKGDLAFIRVLIGEGTVHRLMEFLEKYEQRLDSLGNPGPWYGGAFYPRYYGEGSGCSAFVISFLDLAGVLQEEFHNWNIDINIPMDLLGGPINGNHQVKLSSIRKSREWSSISETAGKDYEPFMIYDPTLIFNWINVKHDQPDTSGNLPWKPVTHNKSKGIEIDARHIPVPSEPIFMHRKNPTIFTDYFIQTNWSGE